ncbi:polyphosphate kinase 2 [Streptomyces sp. IMTB 2501]|uniref:polyphosphate kinase 2 n=1 Tax=Streptomyces sp. IMTB 2501 TaxID=1776340 RepID=UPI00096BF9AA|nr:polyphosphate kinase 2 [Streptomyces sp. IMTB 2501]OLZ73385.1 polyphosphate kinase 2 [Streptomyces sp. IMTB 2501]
MAGTGAEKLARRTYEKELLCLQTVLVKLQEWMRSEGARLVVVFEGRDAAGKGGTIQRVTQYLNPRIARIVALPKPTERERTQWYFQRHVEHLPAAGEILLFSVSDTEQQERFRRRLDDPLRRWKLSPMDLESITRWEAYSRAKDEMLVHTDVREAPWYVVESDDKHRARLNMIAHLLSTVPYHDVPPPVLELPHRPPSTGYERPPRDLQTYVPDHAASL